MAAPKVRCISSIDDTIKVSLFDAEALDDVHAISHRFEERHGANIKEFKVVCEDGDSWTALLSDEEVANLKTLLETYPNIWLDVSITTVATIAVYLLVFRSFARDFLV